MPCVQRGAQVMGKDVGEQIAVGAGVGMVPEGDIFAEKLPVVGQIEVAGQKQRPREAARLVDERMAEGDVAPAESRIAEVSQKNALVVLYDTPCDLSQQIDKR